MAVVGDLRRCQQLRLDIAAMRPPTDKPCADIKPYPWCQERTRHACPNASWLHERCSRTCGLCKLTPAQREWEATHERAQRVCNAVISEARTCQRWFIDAGANVGDSLDQWFTLPGCWAAEGVLLPGCNGNLGLCGRRCYSRWPASLPIELRRQHCAWAFEPNEKHWPKLKRLADAMRVRYGTNVTLSDAAFADASGNASFGIDTVDQRGVGSSLELSRRTTGHDGKKGHGPSLADQHSVLTVRKVGAPSFLESLAGSGDADVVLKIDIEGSEYAVLTALLNHSVFCRRVSDLFVEWHDINEPAHKQTHRWIVSQLHGRQATHEAPRSQRQVRKRTVAADTNRSVGCRTRLHTWG
jgi:FkbM family methyltransferase